MSDTAKKQVRKLKIIEDDPNLSAFEGDLNERVRHFKQRKKELLAPGQTLTEFASGEENALVDLMDLCDAQGVPYAYMGVGDTSGIHYRPVG